ncbi:MAG TPA: hypothetical protein VEB40_14280 [Flavipsychrobacter sp.]|nr:hypothetical protein [Flavipsychrobacter sp.]
MNTIVSTHDLIRPNNIPYAITYQAFDRLNPFRDKNLVKTLSVSGSVNVDVTYTYEFDSKGRVTKQRLSAVQGSTTTLDSLVFTYRCIN